jgi:LPS O-antigen subunit length determinant protein (WzzB/FepE family)
MSKTQRLFRYLWRANAILIFVATAAISLLAGSMLVSELDWQSEDLP